MPETVVKFVILGNPDIIQTEDLNDVLNYVCNNYYTGFLSNKEYKELDGVIYITYTIYN